MKTKLFGSFILSIFIVAMFGVFVSAVTFAEWPLTSDGVATNINSDVTAGNFAFGSTLTSIGFDVTDGAVAEGWNTGALGVNDYYEVTLSPNSGFDLTIGSVSFNHISSNSTTNMSFDVEWSTDGFVTSTNIGSAVVSTTSSTSFSDTSTINVADGETLNLRIFGYDSDNSSTETFSVKDLILDGTAIPTSTEPLEITACSAIGNPGELKVKSVDFNNLGTLVLKETNDAIYLKFGDDDEWFPLDDLEVEIEIENNGNENVDDIEVEWGIYNTKRNEMIIDFDEEDEVNIKDGKDEIILAEFNLEDELDVDLDDLDDGKNYRFYVIATGDVDNSTADRTCVADFETLEIVIENDFVILNNVQFPETVQCGETVQISAKVWNIGEDDQDEVKVEVHNNDLGLFHKTTEIGDIDAFDDDAYNFNFKVPNDAEEKTYTLIFSVLDEDSDVYENDFDDDESEFSLPFRVEGNCGVVSKAVVSANLESGGKAGEELVVRATVTNTGDTDATYLVSAAGYASWASSANVNPTSFTLNPGDSRDVLITLNVMNDASGDELFDIEVLSGNELAARQPVSVLIEEEGRGGFLTGGVIGSLGDNTYLWAFGFLNIILVIVIIVVAVRVMRK